MTVAATLVARAANLSVSLKQDSDEFVGQAGDFSGQIFDEVATEVARGQDPRTGMVRIPV